MEPVALHTRCTHLSSAGQQHVYVLPFSVLMSDDGERDLRSFLVCRFHHTPRAGPVDGRTGGRGGIPEPHGDLIAHWIRGCTAGHCWRIFSRRFWSPWPRRRNPGCPPGMTVPRLASSKDMIITSHGEQLIGGGHVRFLSNSRFWAALSTYTAHNFLDKVRSTR